MGDFTPGFVETGSTRMRELTDEDVKLFMDHKEEFNEAFDKAEELIKEALEAHKYACEHFDEVFRGKKKDKK